MLWTGDPDCQAAHDHLLAELAKAKIHFLPSGTAVSTRRKGNLGEFISLAVGRANDFSLCRVFAANAFNPLSDNSRTDLDLLWLFFGPSAADDFGVVQEVKTTGNASLGYADRLIEDYGKLFSGNFQFTLQSRLGSAANAMEGLGFPSDLCCRTRDLGGISPATSPQVRLTPTLVHERIGANPATKLATIKSTLVSSEGWAPASIDCWSIALQDLDSRLARLAWGQP